jgi:hypothetical protein
MVSLGLGFGCARLCVHFMLMCLIATSKNDVGFIVGSVRVFISGEVSLIYTVLSAYGSS